MIRVIYILFLLNLSISFAQTGRWTNLHTENAPSKRIQQTMVNAGNGKVLLFGGDWHYNYTNDLWLYDYNTNNWEEIKTELKPLGRDAHAFCPLNDSLFLLFGGRSSGFNILNDSWIFNINTLEWTQLEIENPPPARYHHDMVNIDENKALLFGGMGQTNHMNDTWIFNLDSMNFTELKFDILKDGPLPHRRENVRMTSIGNKKIMLYGGWAYKVMNDVWIFDLNTGKWERLESNPDFEKKDFHSMCQLSQNQVLVFGGNTGTNDFGNQTILIKPQESSWKIIEINESPPAKNYTDMAKLSENKALLFGGHSLVTSDNDTWLFELDPTDVGSLVDNSEVITLRNNYRGIGIEITAASLFPATILVTDVLGRQIYKKESHEKYFRISNLGSNQLIFITVSVGSEKYIYKIITK